MTRGQQRLPRTGMARDLGVSTGPAPSGRRRGSAAYEAFRVSGYAYLVLLVAAAFAFWPRYLSILPSGPDWYAHVHAMAATAWCLLLIVQPLLAGAGRWQLHRRVGTLSYAVAPLLAIASLLLAHARFAVMPLATFEVEAPNLFLPLSAVFLLALSFSLAIVFRRTLPLHARFMIATGLTMIDPVLGRVLYYLAPPISPPLLYQAITFGVADVVLIVLLWRPRMTSGQRRIFAAAAAAFPLAHAAWFTVVQGPAWLPVAAWFRSLSLP